MQGTMIFRVANYAYKLEVSRDIGTQVFYSLSVKDWKSSDDYTSHDGYPHPYDSGIADSLDEILAKVTHAWS